MKDKSMRTREELERPHSLSFHLFYLNLFKTILIGLKLPTNLFMSGQKDIFLFDALPVLLKPERHLKVVH
jgi:hypothetical protein